MPLTSIEKTRAPSLASLPKGAAHAPQAGGLGLRAGRVGQGRDAWGGTPEAGRLSRAGGRTGHGHGHGRSRRRRRGRGRRPPSRAFNGTGRARAAWSGCGRGCGRGAHGGEWPADHLAAVDDDHGATLQLPAYRGVLLEHAERREDLGDGEGRAWQHALLAVVLGQRADVVVQCVPVAVVEALDVLLERDHISQICVRGQRWSRGMRHQRWWRALARVRAGRLTVVDRPTEARIVHHDPVHRRVGVGLDHRRLQRMLLHAAQLVTDGNWTHRREGGISHTRT